MSKTILIVDDDVELCSLMKDFFRNKDSEQSAPHMTAKTGLVRALEGAFDLVILDAMLPVLDGFEVLRLLRKQSAGAPRTTPRAPDGQQARVNRRSFSGVQSTGGKGAIGVLADPDVSR